MGISVKTFKTKILSYCSINRPNTERGRFVNSVISDNNVASDSIINKKEKNLIIQGLAFR
jgi:hypothetical protein